MKKFTLPQIKKQGTLLYDIDDDKLRDAASWRALKQFGTNLKTNIDDEIMNLLDQLQTDLGTKTKELTDEINVVGKRMDQLKTDLGTTTDALIEKIDVVDKRIPKIDDDFEVDDYNTDEEPQPSQELNPLG